ncbi:hypothetical protein VNI00_005593 [Paramarasmius palmivorus]|uniref:Uncharacterized protein n=1 Tax=Paramarasmius palmivorus TaxID=297713 RepID=A0AAW0DH50_9AGAR
MFTQIPSLLRGIEHKAWQIAESEAFQFPEDFTIDPSRNLLVCLYRHASRHDTVFEVKPLSVESGKPHPDASNPSLRVTCEDVVSPTWSYDIRTFDRFIGALCTPDEVAYSELMLWNWETGELIKRVEGPMSFAFLSERYIMYTVERMEDNATIPILALLNLDQGSRSQPFLELQVVKDFIGLLDVSIHTECPPATQQRCKAPFGTNFQDRLFVVCIRMFNYRDEEAYHFALFLRLSELLRLAEDAEEILVSWESWGPKRSKLLEIDFSDVWVCFVYGLKAVVMNPRPNPSAIFPKEFRLLDFNDSPIRRGGDVDDNVEVSLETVTGATQFRTPVTTSLPCRIIKGSVPESSSAIMLSEDALLTVSDDESEMTLYSF